MAGASTGFEPVPEVWLTVAGTLSWVDFFGTGSGFGAASGSLVIPGGLLGEALVPGAGGRLGGFGIGLDFANGTGCLMPALPGCATFALRESYDLTGHRCHSEIRTVWPTGL